MAETLAAMDPAHAEVYQPNAASAIAALETLEAEITHSLDAGVDGGFVVTHNAYHYFEARFRAEASDAISLADGAAARPARLAALRETVATTGANCALVEPQAQQGLVKRSSQMRRSGFRRLVLWT